MLQQEWTGGANEGSRSQGHRRTRLARGVAGFLAFSMFGAARPPNDVAREHALVPASADYAASWDYAASQDPTGFADEEVAAARHLLARATYGVREKDLTRILALGRDAWVEEQLFPTRVSDALLEVRLADFPAATMSQDALYAGYPPPQILRRRLLRRAEDGSTVNEPEPSDLQAELRREMRERGVRPPARILFDLVGAKVQRAVYSERQLEAVMTDFWFNHFNVFFAKGVDRWLVSEYEREVIQPHVFGSFNDLLLATARHPAMLFYLDNWQNVAPDSMRAPNRRDAQTRGLPPAVRRRVLEERGLDKEQIERIERLAARSAERGINENYARELLELHTLGVDGGYTQGDVAEVARVFTGWTVAREGASRSMAGLRAPGSQASPIEFRFRPQLHDTGSKIVLGQPIEGSAGARASSEGEEVIRLLARHPSTARHIATKLAVAFAADEPPAALVSELERVFLETDGDLRELTRTLFTSEVFYDESNYESKIKSPLELVVSALRVAGADVGPSRALLERLDAMGQLPYMAQEPTGYPAKSEDWASAGGVLQRVNFALALAGNHIAGIRTTEQTFARASSAESVVESVLATVLPGAKTTALAAMIEIELTDVSDEDEFERTLGLALGSPEFQRR